MHSREVDRQSRTGLIFLLLNSVPRFAVLLAFTAAQNHNVGVYKLCVTVLNQQSSTWSQQEETLNAHCQAVLQVMLSRCFPIILLCASLRHALVRNSTSRYKHESRISTSYVSNHVQVATRDVAVYWLRALGWQAIGFTPQNINRLSPNSSTVCY